MLLRPRLTCGSSPLSFNKALTLACFVWALVLLLSCGPALTEQQQLAAMSHTMLMRCQAARVVCTTSDVRRCMDASKRAVAAIQKAQEARAAGLPDADLSVTAAGLTSVARSICAL